MNLNSFGISLLTVFGDVGFPRPDEYCMCEPFRTGKSLSLFYNLNLSCPHGNSIHWVAAPLDGTVNVLLKTQRQPAKDHPCGQERRRHGFSGALCIKILIMEGCIKEVADL